MQTAGNLCLSLAGLLYLIPLQHLLLEMARKKDDGGGAIVGSVILLAMWTLLLVGLELATARGGFDWIPLRRGALHALVAAAAIALAVATFVSFTALARPTWTTRLVFGWPLYLIPLLTIAVVASVLNPGLATRFSPALVRIPWAILASLSLLACTAFLGYKAVSAVARQALRIPAVFARNQEVTREHLALVPTLDPQKDFSDLLGYADSFEAKEVRALATAKLRTHPDLIAALIGALGERDPAKALDFIGGTEFSAAERQQLAAPVRDAIVAFSDKVHTELRYTPKERQKLIRQWGRPLFRDLAASFADMGVDFAPALEAFEQAFTPDGDS